MKHTRTATLITVAVVALLSVQHASAQGPLTGIRAETGALLWQPAAEVMDASGQWLVDEIPWALRTRQAAVEELVRRAQSARGTGAVERPCFTRTVPLHSSPTGVRNSHPATFAELVGSARAVLTGTVLATEGGFLLDRAGILLTVSGTHWLARFEGEPAPEKLYVFYPVGRFRLGPIDFCSQDSKWPDPPAPGSRLLLFPQAPPVSQDPMALWLMRSGAEIIYEAHDVLYAPRTLHEIDELRRPIGFQRLQKLVEQFLAGSNGPSSAATPQERGR